MTRLLLLLASHGMAIGLGFAAGIYALPILTAPPAPAQISIEAAAEISSYSGEFSRERTDSDFLHWGEGTVSLSERAISLEGELAPGPDYYLYLAREFVETEHDFNRLKQSMVQVGPIKTFNNFMIDVPPGVDISDYNTVIVWCESFGEFITSAMYVPRET